MIGLVVLLFPPALQAKDDHSELSSQSDAHQLFLLRDTESRHQRSHDFFAGEVACAFNDTATCEEEFKRIIAAGPNPNAARQIHHVLAYAALREGRYRRSLSEIDALLAIDPKDSDAQGTRPFLEALSHFPDQAVQEGGRTKVTVQMDDGKLPLLINGAKASYFFDTGANLSTLSESEVLRLGMEIRDVNANGSATDVNGNTVLFRIALAKSLALGDIVLDNVAFLVASNQQQPFVDMEPGQRGLIGLPVLRAFGSMRWNRGGKFEVDRSPKRPRIAAANLFFDDLLLIAEASFENHRFPFVLDTGAVNTDLWPRFAGVAGDLIRKSGTPEGYSSTGMAGSQTFAATSIPRVVLRLGGKSVTLQPAHVLETQQATSRQWFYGNIGNDLLGQAQEISIDFRTMVLQLDPITAAMARRGSHDAAGSLR